MLPLMTKISTLADIAREGWAVWANCTNEHCGRARPLDVVALIRRFGGNHSIINETDITSRLRCECGHKGGALHFRPPNKADHAVSSNARSDD